MVQLFLETRSDISVDARVQLRCSSVSSNVLFFPYSPPPGWRLPWHHPILFSLFNHNMNKEYLLISGLGGWCGIFWDIRKSHCRQCQVCIQGTDRLMYRINFLWFNELLCIWRAILTDHVNSPSTLPTKHVCFPVM